MLWTAEAVDSLRRLAREGRSASVIAAALGAASRNAVIGKANRIGVRLNGDGRASAPDEATPGADAAAFSAPSRPLPGRRGSASARSPEPGGKAAWAFAEAAVGEMRRVSFADIRRSACRWPLGDPRSGDFAYCGLEPADGRSYCPGHCRMAYRPSTARAKPEPHERSWSRAFANSWRLS